MTGRRGVRGFWAIADAVGYAVLVFAFLPPLAALPRWLWFEAQNPLNVEDAVVVTFLPIRGTILLLNAFAEGFIPGVLAGLLYGAIISTWIVWRGDVRPPRRRMVLGAGAGVAAASVVVLATLARNALQDQSPAVPFFAVGFETVSGLVCGMVAGPTAVRLLVGDGADATA